MQVYFEKVTMLTKDKLKIKHCFYNFLNNQIMILFTIKTKNRITFNFFKKMRILAPNHQRGLITISKLTNIKYLYCRSIKKRDKSRRRNK